MCFNTGFCGYGVLLSYTYIVICTHDMQKNKDSLSFVLIDC